MDSDIDIDILLTRQLRHATTAWVDAGSSCADQYSETLPVVATGTVDRTTLGTYTVSYACTTNSGGTTLATWIASVASLVGFILHVSNALCISVPYFMPYSTPYSTPAFYVLLRHCLFSLICTVICDHIPLEPRRSQLVASLVLCLRVPPRTPRRGV